MPIHKRAQDMYRRGHPLHNPALRLQAAALLVLPERERRQTAGNRIVVERQQGQRVELRKLGRQSAGELIVIEPETL
eukprot:6490175-Prymnesium_polylepis.1